MNKKESIEIALEEYIKQDEGEAFNFLASNFVLLLERIVKDNGGNPGDLIEIESDNGRTIKLMPRGE